MEIKGSSQGRQNLGSPSDIKTGSTQEATTDGEIKNVSGTKNSKSEQVTSADAKKAVDKVNKLLEDKTTHLEYEEDKNFNSVLIMKVVDNNTHEVLSEIPSKQIMDLIAQFAEMAGLVLDKKV